VANIKSQIKRNRTNEAARLRNKGVRSEIRTRTKNAIAAVGTDDEVEALRIAIKRIDKSAAAGVIHKNQAANRKSRLTRRVNSMRATG
jgi:small subunit ribosomal protein S20